MKQKTKKSPYDQRPWLKAYSPWVPPELKAPRESMVQVFRRAVSGRGAAPALLYFGRSISYDEMDRWSDALACALQESGLQKGDRVIFIMQNIPAFAVAQYAVWKAGGIVVPLNPMYKEKELAYYFQDCGAKAVIALGSVYESTVKHLVERLGLRIVITTSGQDLLREGDAVSPVLEGEERKNFPGALDFLELLQRYDGRKPEPAELSPDDAAYLTYTSGTTGPPKGALNTHAGITFNASFYVTALRLAEGDIILGVAPLFHVTGQVAHLAAAVYAGIPVILFFRFDPGEALRLAEQWKATMTMGSITVFVSLSAHPDLAKRDLSGFKKVYTGGAPVPSAVVEDFEKISGIYIHNAYGLTETNSPTHLTPLGSRAPVDPETGALSIGIPICNASCRIMDLETGERELPVGETGEIAVKGPMVIPGYWNKTRESAHAIRDGWLYTGDVGKMDEKGWFYIVDRKKDLIIASGYKVWPREVEDVLYQHPAVKEAAVIGVPDSYRGETVKAFVSIKEPYRGKTKPEELIEFCRNRLAAYKYPRIVEIAEGIPKTTTGKFLRRILREKEGEKKQK